MRQPSTWTPFVLPLLKTCFKNMNPTQAIQRLRQVIRLQHKAIATEETYVFWLRRYISALQSMTQELSSENKLVQF